jgi:RND family efflux transporter MFP subunit
VLFIIMDEGTTQSQSGKSPLEELRSLRIERQRDTALAARGGVRVPWGWLIALAVVGGVAYFAVPAVRGWYLVRTAPAPETAVVVKSGGIESVLSASGYVNADATVMVGTTVAGRLRVVTVHKGDRVKHGELLAELEDDELRAELGVQQATLTRDERALARQETLHRSGATTEETFENARSQVESDRAQVQLTLARLKQTRIVSPIDGKVLDRLVEPGAIVTPSLQGDVGILRLADLRKTVVEVDVNEADIGKLARGQSADVLLDAYPDHPYAGVLREFAQMADKAKATVQVKVFLSAPDDNVRPGMAAKVTFHPAAPRAAGKVELVMPRAALLAGGEAVFVVHEGRIERREVTTQPAAAGADTLAIVRGLREGDEVVTSGQERLQAGQKLPRKSD